MTKTTRENNQQWRYGYNTKGEVTSAAKWNDNASTVETNILNGTKATYVYNEIGNRTSLVVGGATGSPTYSTGYTANAVNQYTAISNPNPAGYYVSGYRGSAGDVVDLNQNGVVSGVNYQIGDVGLFFSKPVTAGTTNGYDQLTFQNYPVGRVFTTTQNSSTISAPNHSFANNAAVKLLSSGWLPWPLNTTTTYYVRDVVTGSSGSFKLATTVGGTAITVTGTATGTHTACAHCQQPNHAGHELAIRASGGREPDLR